MPIEHRPYKTTLPGCSESVFDAIEARHKMSTFQSPFQVIKERFPQTKFEDMFPCMQYTGSLRAVIAELSEALISPMDYPHFYRMATHPPLLTRATIDWKIDNPGVVSANLVKDAIEIAQNVYRKNAKAKEQLALFFQQASTIADLLDAPLLQKADFPTWHGTDPELSYQTARDLAFNLEGEDILFIPLGHGATAAGIDVFSRYVDITQSALSRIYIARFSRNKKKDEQPRLSDDEIEYLKEIAKRKQIVIFEEDSVTHNTINKAYNYFQNELFTEEPVWSCQNLNAGSGESPLKHVSIITEIPENNLKKHIPIITYPKIDNKYHKHNYNLS